MPAVAAGGALPPPGGGGAPAYGGGQGYGGQIRRPGLRRRSGYGRLRPGLRRLRVVRRQAIGYPAANGYAPPATVPPPSYQQQQRVRHLLTVDGSQQWLELQVGSNVIGRGDRREPAPARRRDLPAARPTRLRRRAGGAHDLGSTNGTTVNGHRVSALALQHGDIVQSAHRPGLPAGRRVRPGPAQPFPQPVARACRWGVAAHDHDRRPVLRFGSWRCSGFSSSPRPRCGPTCSGGRRAAGGGVTAGGRRGQGQAGPGRAPSSSPRARSPGTRITLGESPITIGRAEDSTLVITDDYASPRHARLVPRRAVVRRGSRLDQRHLPRPRQGHRTHPRPPRRADPHRPHFPRVDGHDISSLRYAARSDRGLIRGRQPGLRLRRAAAARRRRRHGRHGRR